MGCKEESTSSNLMTGLIQYFPPPDNCNDYVVRVEDKLYYPVNLAEEFRQDSLTVQLSFDVTDSVHNCGFGGSIPVIKVLTIKK